jgi:hypothetical protein
MAVLVLFRTAERPNVKLWLQDDNRTLMDLTGYTFEFKIGTAGKTAVFTKTTGITGAAGTGTEPTGTPNVVMTFTSGELDALVKIDKTGGQVKATTGGLDRFWVFDVQIKDVIA